MALGGVAGHQMATALFPVHRGGLYISSLRFRFFSLWFGFGPPTPLLPFLYAVMQADVGLFCCVLLSLSPLPPDYIPTSRREERIKKNIFICSTWITEKSVKINMFKKKLNVLQFSFHCQILNGALYLDWVYFHMQSII